MNPWAILAVVVAFVLNGFYWDHHGHAAADTDWAAKTEKARADGEASARTKEHMWQGVVDGTVKNYEKQVARISDQRDAALISLRDRPERAAAAAENPRPECAGANGAELSREDGEFLTREAARADTLRAGLDACYKVMDRLSNTTGQVQEASGIHGTD